MCILTCQSTCAAVGRGHRRGSFAWCRYRYHMALVLESFVQKGAKALWMGREAWITRRLATIDGSEFAAAKSWMMAVESAPKDRLPSDRQRILVDVEDFVISTNTKSHSEHLHLVTDSIKIPSVD